MTGSVVSSACVALLATALATPVFAQTAEPEQSPALDPGPLRMHDARFSHMLTTLPDGSALVVGGSDGEVVLSTAEVFDPASRRFRVVGSLNEARARHTATVLADGRVLIVGGGSVGTQGLATVEVYDAEAEGFGLLGRLKVPRVDHAATLLDDGRVLITGGYGKGKKGRSPATAEVFDPATGKSQLVGKLRQPRSGHTATLLQDGRVAIVGGYDDRGKARRAIEVYDPRTERFRSTARLVAPAHRPVTNRLLDGRLLLVHPAGSILIAPDAAGNELVASGPQPAYATTATLLDDGRVVTIGSDGVGADSVHVFDPATNEFEPAEPMTLTRIAPMASRLADGTVLVVGGLGCQQALDTAEIWDPEPMAAVAAGSKVDCELQPMPSLPPLPPLGATTSGGRIEMPGSAFAITVPDEWTVEFADPDGDVFGAEAGMAWEAFRAINPAGTRACSVAIGVADVSLRNGSGTGSNGDTTPKWHPSRRDTLMVPSPSVVETDRQTSSMAPMERLHRDHEGLEHDALYSIHCVGVPERQFERIMFSLEFLPHEE